MSHVDETALPQADLTVSPDFYQALSGRSTDAESDHKLTMRQYNALEKELHAQLHPNIWDLVIGLAEQRDRINQTRTDTMLAELMRHLPGVAPAIQVVWDHVQNTNPENIGWCCAGEGTIEEHEDAG